MSPRRRGNHEGSVYWWAARRRWVVRVTPPEGRRRTYYCKTEAEAKRKLRSLLSAIERGEALAREDLTLARYLTEIYLPVDERRRPLPNALLKGKPSHTARTEEIIRLHILPTPLARMRLSRIHPLDVKRWRDAKMAEVSMKTHKSHSPTHVRLMQVTLRGALNEAARLELVPRNPAALIALPQKSDFEGSAWSVDDAARFLSAVRGDRLENLYVCALLTGLRQGELLGLRWADVLGTDSRLVVASNIVWIHGRPVVGTPKSKRSVRTVPVVPMALRALERQQARQAAERLAAKTWEENNLVFPNTVGQPVNPSTFRTRSWQPLVARAGVPGIRFQDMRGTTATLLRFLGTPEDVIQDLLGHATAATTRRHYIHLRENPAVRQALGQLSVVLGGLGDASDGGLPAGTGS